jgi:hypothetical protein
MIIGVSSDRWFLRSIRIVSALLLLLSVTPSARADDTWHNIYHSLKRFFTGESSSSPSPNHRSKRSAKHVRTDRSSESASTTLEGSPEPGASPTPRVVVLPAASPAPESDQEILSAPAKPETPVKPEAAVKPEASPNLTPVLLSLPQATPNGSPSILPSATPGTGNAKSN